MFLLVFLSHLAQVPSAHSWWSDTHQFIASNAIDLLPDSLDWFFSTYKSAIVGYSSVEWEPKHNHWYHVDVPHGEDDPGDGTLPWAVEDKFDMFVQYLKENNLSGAAQIAGEISHYIGDGSNPLHATSDYNPGGNGHYLYESTVNSRRDEINMSMPGFVPEELENVFSSTMRLLEESYSYTSVLNPYLLQGISWNDEIKDLTEERLRASAQLHANIWYTGMVQAGLVTKGVDVSVLPDYQSTPPGTMLTYTVIIANTGNVSDTYALTVSDNENWGPTISPTSLTVSGGGSGTATLSIKVPDDVAEGDSTTITVTATGTGHENISTCAATATNVSPPRNLVPVAVGGAVVGGGVAVALLLKKGIIHLPSMSSHLQSD